MTTSDSTNHRRIVAVYGSAGVTPGEPDWQVAHEVGRSLGAAGYCVLSGGYGGVMAACSQGAAEAGGHVMGAEVGLFKQRGLEMNRWVTERVPFETLRDRLYFLVQRPDAFVVLRGGVGTLSELALLWSLLQVGEIPARPCVLVGSMWRRIVEVFAETAPISAADVRWLTLVERAEEVVPALEAWWAAPPDVPLRLGDQRP
ncbi:MAG: LOG family protein [Anaerolineae bacterium]|nr:LOG family protein [Anaerolineae bacterium]